MVTKPTAAIQGLTTNSSSSTKPRHERDGREPDAPREMRVEVGATDLLDELRVVLGEPPLDLLEDALFVFAQGHASIIGRQPDLETLHP